MDALITSSMYFSLHAKVVQIVFYLETEDLWFENF